MLTPCVECGRNVVATASFCPFCGATQPRGRGRASPVAPPNAVPESLSPPPAAVLADAPSLPVEANASPPGDAPTEPDSDLTAPLLTAVLPEPVDRASEAEPARAVADGPPKITVTAPVVVPFGPDLVMADVPPPASDFWASVRYALGVRRARGRVATVASRAETAARRRAVERETLEDAVGTWLWQRQRLGTEARTVAEQLEAAEKATVAARHASAVLEERVRKEAGGVHVELDARRAAAAESTSILQRLERHIAETLDVLVKRRGDVARLRALLASGKAESDAEVRVELEGALMAVEAAEKDARLLQEKRGDAVRRDAAARVALGHARAAVAAEENTFAPQRADARRAIDLAERSRLSALAALAPVLRREGRAAVQLAAGPGGTGAAVDPLLAAKAARWRALEAADDDDRATVETYRARLGAVDASVNRTGRRRLLVLGLLALLVFALVVGLAALFGREGVGGGLPVPAWARNEGPSSRSDVDALLRGEPAYGGLSVDGLRSASLLAPWRPLLERGLVRVADAAGLPNDAVAWSQSVAFAVSDGGVAAVISGGRGGPAPWSGAGTASISVFGPGATPEEAVAGAPTARLRSGHVAGFTSDALVLGRDRGAVGDLLTRRDDSDDTPLTSDAFGPLLKYVDVDATFWFIADARLVGVALRDLTGVGTALPADTRRLLRRATGLSVALHVADGLHLRVAVQFGEPAFAQSARDQFAASLRELLPPKPLTLIESALTVDVSESVLLIELSLAADAASTLVGYVE
ncbi:MAG: hypothetical protein IV100_28485 [Myxococcales bacterium]|nr:hypothetical protein [Myxococcales bacterium]